MDPDTFEEKKYTEHFPKLQTAYRRAFNELNGQYDSTLVHAIDQEILDESEPVYEEGAFRVQLPEDPLDRVDGVVADRERVGELLELYVEELEDQLAAVFGEIGGEEKA
jgi:hypothetical protein